MTPAMLDRLANIVAAAVRKGDWPWVASFADIHMEIAGKRSPEGTRARFADTAQLMLRKYPEEQPPEQRRARVVRPEADGLAAVIELRPRRKRAEEPLVVPDPRRPPC